MRTKSRPVPRKALANRDAVPFLARAIVPLKERRLLFGNKWNYAPAPESFDYIKIPTRHELFIDGKFVAPRAGKYFESLNPATEETLSEIASADEVDVDAAVKA